MILSVRINTYSGKWTDLSEQEYVDLREAIPMLPEKKDPHLYQTLVVDDDGLRALSRLGLDINLKDHDGSGTMIVKLQDKLEALGLQQATLSRQIAENCAVQIAIPDLGLMTIQTVTVLTNCCTDTLQDYLDKGWRILAVCPPNSERRPAYVIGRKEKPE